MLSWRAPRFTDTAPSFAATYKHPYVSLPSTSTNALQHPTPALHPQPHQHSAPSRPRTPHPSVLPLPSARTIQIQHTTAVRQGAGWTVHRRRSRCPTRPVSSPSTVRLSGSLVRTRLSGRLVSSPSGVRPAGVQARPASSRLLSTRPPWRIRLVPRQPVIAMGDTRYGGAS
jgi:hypothetical protein